MRSLVFEGRSWLVYEELRQRDRQLHRNLRAILKELLRADPTIGLGKPEAPRHNLTGFWSRRLSQQDRLIYKFDETHLYVFAIGGHYDQFEP
jgi:toxin YoeB